MKRTLALILSVLLLTLCFSACRSAANPGTTADAEAEPTKTFEGCTKAASCGLSLVDGTCSAVILNTDEGRIGLLIRRGTVYEIPDEAGGASKTVTADGFAESIYHNGDTEVRAEGCVKAEKPADLDLGMEPSAWYTPEKLVVLNQENPPATTAKPVIYLYPETETEVNVRLDFSGDLTCTYPAYGTGWTVTAAPDGTLTDANGQTYSYLYWEGEGGWEPDLTTGFCVPGNETAAFLETALAQLGLTRREANEFIVYWLPLMQDNAYNLISFQQTAYTDAAKLEISPSPDTLIRVFMAWQPLTEPVEAEPQTLTAPDRTGFTVVEWGGRCVD